MTQTRYDDNCLSCRGLQGKLTLTNIPRIFETKYWVVEHVYPTSIKGWLVLVLNRHAGALHEVTAEEFADFGRLLQTTCQALHEILGAEKEYAIQLAEKEGFPHVHFHVIARLPDWTQNLKGTAVFSAMGDKAENPLTSDDLAPFGLQVRQYLEKNL